MNLAPLINARPDYAPDNHRQEDYYATTDLKTHAKVLLTKLKFYASI